MIKAQFVPEKKSPFHGIQRAGFSKMDLFFEDPTT